MVVKGKVRGYGRGLASYLLTLGQNERIRLLDVDGQSQFNEQDFRNLLGDFSLNEKLTRSRKGVYHCMLNPDIETSTEITDDQWLQAADILGKETGFENQRRAIVLHKKGGRVHAHVVFERYDHEKERMISISHNYKKHDRARAKLEQLFGEKPTARINPNRQAMKETLTELWQQTDTAKEFVTSAKEAGYIVTKGYDKIPYMVIDDSPRSFNLARHLKGVKKKEVMERLKNYKLMSEKDGLAFASNRKLIATKAAPNNTDQRQVFLESLAQNRNQKQAHKPRLH